MLSQYGEHRIVGYAVIILLHIYCWVC